ncbi:PIN domain-containing protein [bacterium]|nr:PIN domain-containing protein [bacterium]
MEAGVVHLDTHVVVWLYSGLLHLVPSRIALAIDENSLRVSPIVALEIQYLYETRRITIRANTILEDLDLRIGLRLDRLSFARVARQSLLEKWTRDPFDRLIVAQARIRQVPLLTKDRTIRKHYKNARW